jgi:hypothetical protein
VSCAGTIKSQACRSYVPQQNYGGAFGLSPFHKAWGAPYLARFSRDVGYHGTPRASFRRPEKRLRFVVPHALWKRERPTGLVITTTDMSLRPESERKLVGLRPSSFSSHVRLGERGAPVFPSNSCGLGLLVTQGFHGVETGGADCGDHSADQTDSYQDHRRHQDGAGGNQ